MRLIIFTFFISISALASNWSELRPGVTYILLQAFQIQQDERSGSLLNFPKEESLRLKEIFHSNDQMLYVFDYINCPGAALKTNLEMIPVYGIEVGAKVKECELNIYLERKNRFYQSLFE